MNYRQLAEDVQGIALALQRRDFRTERGTLPRDGIYLFFERGETAPVHGLVAERIVRVGTHRQDGRFPARIRQHYGQVRSLRGNKNGSVFRRHVGGALLARSNPQDPRLAEWQRQGGTSYVEVEEVVSKTLRDDFTFVCFRVDKGEERLTLERGLIALLAQHPIAGPSPAWLGHHAIATDIQHTGLWNMQRARAEPLTSVEFGRLKNLCGAPA